MLDPELCRTATERLIALLCELDAGVRVISAFTDVYVNRYPTIVLEFNKAYVDRYTGIDISVETIVKTLTGLGFKVVEKDGSFSVTVPSWRSTKDVTIKADIIEEITRIYGYDNFDIFTSSAALAPVRKEVQKSEEDRMKDMLVKAYRLHEVHSYIWSDDAKNRELGITTDENVKVINAQTPDHQYLRISMIPTLLAMLKENRSYRDEFGIFEIGHTVEGLRENGLANEQKKLGVALYSKASSEEELFLRARDAAAELVSDILHVDAEFVSAECDFGFEHPANCFDILVRGVKVGFLSVPHPTVLANIDKKCAVAFFEINTAAFAASAVAPNKYKEPSRFPAIDIDMTFVCDPGEVVFPKVCAVAKDAASGLLFDVKSRGVYTDEAGVSALTLRFSFVSKDKTLSKQELAPTTAAVAEALGAMGLTIKA